MVPDSVCVHLRPLPYEAALAQRAAEQIDLVVIHCTELPDLATAREYGEKVHYGVNGTGNSGHFYIDRDGRVEQWVDPMRQAHHVRGFNERSIGIELVNLGRYPNWLHTAHQHMQEPYPEAQIDSLLTLLGKLDAELPGLRWLAGHEDLDQERVPASNDPEQTVCRKQDPGPQFPWARIAATSRLGRLGPANDRPG